MKRILSRTRRGKKRTIWSFWRIYPCLPISPKIRSDHFWITQIRCASNAIQFCCLKDQTTTRYTLWWVASLRAAKSWSSKFLKLPTTSKWRTFCMAPQPKEAPGPSSITRLRKWLIVRGWPNWTNSTKIRASFCWARVNVSERNASCKCLNV